MSRRNEDSKAKILSIFTTRKEYPQGKMEQETGLSNKTVVDTLKTLVTTNMLTFRTEPSRAGGKEKKVFALTPRGLFFIIIHSEREDLDLVIKTYSDFCLTFKKVSLFKQAAPVLYSQIYNFLSINYNPRNFDLDTFEGFALSIDCAVLWPFIRGMLSQASNNTCVAGLKELIIDSDINNFINIQITKEEQDLIEAQKMLRNTVSSWKNCLSHAYYDGFDSKQNKDKS